MEPGKIVEFNNSKHLTFIRELGRGGTGQTLLFKDEITDTLFAIKKYDPSHGNEDNRDENFERFIDEIKILFKLSHPNIVRIYNYYLYPDYTLGYIQMEFVEGVTISEYISNNTEDIELIFRDSISAFKCLEENNILHRDIRELNIMITNNGEVKVIDFGFGKELNENNEVNSVYLNWPVTTPPAELIHNGDYTHQTEIYYLGNLFRNKLLQNSIQNYKYMSIIENMCNVNPDDRYVSFLEVDNELTKGTFIDLNFSITEKNIYQRLADDLIRIIHEYTTDFKPINNITKVLNKLEEIIINSSLETYIQKNSDLINCFLENGYSYDSKYRIRVDNIKEFYQLLGDSTPYRREIIISNLYIRLDNIPLRKKEFVFDDDLPF